MLKSMTGYGRCEETVNGRHITAELKSGNHKYFEFSPRVTRGYGFLEDKLKTYVQSRVARGKIDFYLSIETLEDTDVVVSVRVILRRSASFPSATICRTPLPSILFRATPIFFPCTRRRRMGKPFGQT